MFVYFRYASPLSRRQIDSKRILLLAVQCKIGKCVKRAHLYLLPKSRDCHFPFINVLLGIVPLVDMDCRDHQLTSVFLEALTHIFTHSYSRSCSDPVYPTPVIDLGIHTLWAKILLQNFLFTPKIERDEAISLWKSEDVTLVMSILPVHGPGTFPDRENEAREPGLRGRGMEFWWNKSLAPVTLVISLPILDPGPVNSSFCLAGSK